MGGRQRVEIEGGFLHGPVVGNGVGLGGAVGVVEGDADEGGDGVSVALGAGVILPEVVVGGFRQAAFGGEEQFGWAGVLAWPQGGEDVAGAVGVVDGEQVWVEDVLEW